MADQLQVRTVRLELLRPGPSHNQLLSPLTAYLGICGDFPAGVVHVPYEHAVFERRLADLRYTNVSDMRLAQLRDTGVDMGRMLAGVPGLPGSISADSESQLAMIHLRVTLSASELALLPFELSKVPTTTDGESEAWLALQTKPPVCITRRIRTVSAEGVTWPSRPRILFVAGPTGDIPFDAHRRALEQAIAPFCYPGQDDPREGVDSRHTHYGELLTIIENASLEDVVQACRTTNYTHVHVLAHGAVDFSSKGRPFGIRLRSRTGGTDIVSGERFSTALARVDRDQVHRPFLVTLASCDSGLVATVVEPAPGASFAHTLHQSGIPLVVGSQFPLTKEGSVTVVELFYGGLLRGENPHVLAHQTRAELHARYGADTHDWASLVVYEALPTNMDAQLERVRYEQGRLRLNAALERVDIAVREELEAQNDRLTGARPSGGAEGQREQPSDTPREVATRARQRRAALRFDDLEGDVRNAIDSLPADGAYAIECRGLRASAMKRLAQATFLLAAWPADGDTRDLDDEQSLHLGRCCDRLEDALTTYRTASEKFLRNEATAVQRVATLHWVLVQQLAMEAVLRRSNSPELFAVATHAASLYLDHPDVEERAWARASLAELALLQLVSAETPERAEKQEREFLSHIEHMVVMFPAERRFLLSSTEKQFRRYVDWWGRAEFERFAEERIEPDQRLHWPDTERVRKAAARAATLLKPTGPSAFPPRAGSRPHRAGGDAQPADVAPTDTLGRAPTRKARRRPREGAFLDVHMLPAQWGDCLWIEYGTDPRNPSRVLVDCGTRGTCARLLGRIDSIPVSDRHAELFILTHIDDDHIGGAIPFLEAELGGLKVQDVWFNGYSHLTNLLGAEQGERFSALILKNELPWNQWRERQRIAITGDELPQHTLPGGMTLTLLSPAVEQLEALRVRWEQELRAKNITPGAGLEPGALLGGEEGPELLGGDEHSDSEDVEAMAALPFKSDTAAPNGSSIAVLAEFEGKSIILAADAHPPVLASAITQLCKDRGIERLQVGALKVSHHGSHGNTSPELLQLLDCSRYLISTNGQKFSHPHRPTVSRIIHFGGPGCELLFNYAVTGKNDVWGREDLQERYRYKATYPQSAEGLLVRL